MFLWFVIELGVLFDQIVDIRHAFHGDMGPFDEGRVGVIDALAILGRRLPGLFIFDRMQPPGKGAALNRPRLINGAFFISQKDACVGSGRIEQAELPIDDAGVEVDEFLNGYLAMAG